MADVNVTIENVVPAGIDPTLNSGLSVANTYKLRNDGKVWVRINNGGGSACNATFESPGSVGGLAIADRVVNIPAGENRLAGPFPPSLYNDGNGDVNLTFDFITSVTLEALHLG